MNPKSRERFARLGPIRAVSRVPSGSPATFVLQAHPGDIIPQRVDAVMALARRGLSLLEAKRQIEHLLEHCQARVTLPTVESTQALINDLEKAGVRHVKHCPDTQPPNTSPIP